MAKKVGLGVILPLERGANGYFNQGFDAMTQVKSNLTNLLLTKKGERVMQPSFGCDLHAVLFENMGPEIESETRSAIVRAVATWMPYLSIDDVEVVLEEDLNRMFVTIEYSLQRDSAIGDTITLLIAPS